jgi:hypothetical protein
MRCRIPPFKIGITLTHCQMTKDETIKYKDVFHITKLK